MGEFAAVVIGWTHIKDGIFWKSFDQNQTSCKSRHNKQHSGQSWAVRNGTKFTAGLIVLFIVVLFISFCTHSK